MWFARCADLNAFQQLFGNTRHPKSQQVRRLNRHICKGKYIWKFVHLNLNDILGTISVKEAYVRKVKHFIGWVICWKFYRGIMKKTRGKFKASFNRRKAFGITNCMIINWGIVWIQHLPQAVSRPDHLQYSVPSSPWWTQNKGASNRKGVSLFLTNPIVLPIPRLSFLKRKRRIVVQ